MKRIALLFFAFLYLMPAVGFSINVHWCGKKINSVSIGHLKADNCPCGKKMKRNCCSDFHTFVKLDDSHKAAPTVSVAANKLTQPVTLAAFGVIQNNTLIRSFIHFDLYCPSVLCGPPVYLRCCNFRV
jgi:hypothetical protein